MASVGSDITSSHIVGFIWFSWRFCFISLNCLSFETVDPVRISGLLMFSSFRCLGSCEAVPQPKISFVGSSKVKFWLVGIAISLIFTLPFSIINS